MAREKKFPKVDYEICVACGVCIIACPASCIELTYIPPDDEYKKARPELVMPEYCTSCGMCTKACPIDAIELVNADGMQEILAEENEVRKVLAVEKAEQKKLAIEAFMKQMAAAQQQKA